MDRIHETPQNGDGEAREIVENGVSQFTLLQRHHEVLLHCGFWGDDSFAALFHGDRGFFAHRRTDPTPQAKVRIDHGPFIPIV